MKIKEFGVEIWMNDYENTCRYNLAETCVESLTVEQLLEMSGKRDTILDELLPMKLTYGAIEGSDRLRDNIISLYQKQKRDNILITHGAIGANALVHETLISPGDRVIAVLPTYQQHYSIPESYGADVHIVKLKEEKQFLPDLDELRQLATEGTRLIAINNPNNPTGALMDEAFLEQVVDIARSCGAYLLCDEVYRGTDEEGNGFTASVADLYEKGIGTSSMSKTFSLAGLRLGWLAGPLEVIKAVCIHRDYNTISVGMLDDHFASIALECRDAILKRNRHICNTNRDMLDAWVAKEPLISYIRPKSGTTALLKYDLDMSSRDFCVGLLEAKGVMFTPGSVLDMEGYVRIGYANNPQVLETGLAKVSEYLAELQG
ncbi:aminotransferase [Photobacterium proteolyticum]|uniref:Aminotransferase n=1 Tax=Photobacterium proteolyticum TaxID=1903952 RepID=A0A1Q9GLW2_9GAMM|nr:aminotransferase [Photobacterium proteolyticum]OLQ75545.1 aminotransferase [Photobacterium proteolyticum]